MQRKAKCFSGDSQLLFLCNKLLSMKITNILLLLFGVALGALYYLHFSNQQALAYVDTNKLLNNYEGMKAAREAYQLKASAWKANVDTLMTEVRQEIADYEKENQSMSAKEKQLAQELIRTKQQQLADYQKALQNQAAQEDQKMTGEVLATVNAYISKYGEKSGYDIILAATDMGNIVYAKEAVDITDQVLQGLNKEYNGY